MHRWGFVVVRGTSMLPTLVDGDRMLVRYGASARPGALAVVVLPGDVLAVKRLARREPAGWWVERDNPSEGTDSWSVGAIPFADVRAIVVCPVWPPRAVARWWTRAVRP